MLNPFGINSSRHYVGATFINNVRGGGLISFFLFPLKLLLLSCVVVHDPWCKWSEEIKISSIPGRNSRGNIFKRRSKEEESIEMLLFWKIMGVIVFFLFFLSFFFLKLNWNPKNLDRIYHFSGKLVTRRINFQALFMYGNATIHK